MTIKSTFVFCAAILSLAACDHWVVKNGPEVCIILEANVTGVVTYIKSGANKTVEYPFNVTHSEVEGSCHTSRNTSSAQLMEVKFTPNNVKVKDPEDKWSLKIWFSPKDEKTFAINDFELFVNFYDDMDAEDKNRTYLKNADADSEVEAEDKNGFKCSNSALGFENGTAIELKNLRVIAFANLNSTDFPSGQMFEQCSLDERTSTIVPIVVGACLAGLVVIVLIAYLIGRARTKRQGYSSV
ncbi:hypothetical protein AB6A40_000739 [Gnathostoma spinigerum]|uniref:Lysosome-associated membrane glycoprotein 2-like transmembrane domain-containing protein n=1 Tax=Gnathostoma spinigerum TaxID=75299 RepID=A0ABD6E2N3_9BILA